MNDLAAIVLNCSEVGSFVRDLNIITTSQSKPQQCAFNTVTTVDGLKVTVTL